MGVAVNTPMVLWTSLPLPLLRFFDVVALLRNVSVKRAWRSFGTAVVVKILTSTAKEKSNDPGRRSIEVLHRAQRQLEQPHLDAPIGSMRRSSCSSPLQLATPLAARHQLIGVSRRPSSSEGRQVFRPASDRYWFCEEVFSEYRELGQVASRLKATCSPAVRDNGRCCDGPWPTPLNTSSGGNRKSIPARAFQVQAAEIDSPSRCVSTFLIADFQVKARKRLQKLSRQSRDAQPRHASSVFLRLQWPCSCFASL